VEREDRRRDRRKEKERRRSRSEYEASRERERERERERRRLPGGRNAGEAERGGRNGHLGKECLSGH